MWMLHVLNDDDSTSTKVMACYYQASGNKTSREPMLAQFYDAIYHQYGLMSEVHLTNIRQPTI